MSFNFSISTNAMFGAGKLNELHTQINNPMGAVHGKRALVVISNGKSTRANGYLDRLENELKQAGVEYVIFDKVSSNPMKLLLLSLTPLLTLTIPILPVASFKNTTTLPSARRLLARCPTSQTTITFLSVIPCGGGKLQMLCGTLWNSSTSQIRQ